MSLKAPPIQFSIRTAPLNKRQADIEDVSIDVLINFLKTENERLKGAAKSAHTKVIEALKYYQRTFSINTLEDFLNLSLSQSIARRDISIKTLNIILRAVEKISNLNFNQITSLSPQDQKALASRDKYPMTLAELSGDSALPIIGRRFYIQEPKSNAVL